VTVFAVSLVVSLAAVGLTVPVLRRLRLLDRPNERSSHSVAVPRGGGVGALLGLATGAVVAGSVDGARWLPVCGSVAALAALGLLDDVHGLPATLRLGVQLVVCGLTALALVSSSNGGLLVLVWVAATVWLVGVTNVFNFMDGINGISALNAALPGVWYAWLGVGLDADLLVAFGLALAGCAIGFLPWNAVRPRVFLGDVGSYGFGVLLAVLALSALVAGADPLAAAAPLLVYLADTSWALVKRVRRGDPWRQAHREHVYQRLVDAGWPHLRTAVLVTVFSALVCLCVLVLPPWAAVVPALAVVVGYVSLPTWLARPQEG
jgi:UDP-GlcNAc:undecaprenyl-phosphate GlcNAc-1-phosphate transferase